MKNNSQFRFDLPKELHQQAVEKSRREYQTLAAVLRAILEGYVEGKPRSETK
jgi:hypothetical protein